MTEIALKALTKGVKIGDFSCGNDHLDDWLHRHASRTAGEGSNRTHLWVDEDTGRTLGFFTLSPAVVTDNPVLGTEWPAILLGKLAVCEDLRGQEERHGTKLLVEAFRISIAAADLIGGRYLAVDPQTPELISYYEPLGFEIVEDAEDSLRMLQRISVIRQALAEV